jgi:hypothetical protein
MAIRILSPKSWHSTLRILRDRPAMYLGSKTLKGLLYFVEGIRWAEYMYSVRSSDRLVDFNWHRFEPWLQIRLQKQFKRSFLWALEMTKTEEEAFDLWFTWYDEYNATEGKEDYEKWQKHNEDNELNRYLDDDYEDPSLY